ncbi:RNA polymerase sigma factor [Agromyces sp. H3Y2-19a]|uniref:RNA polymerase sigma factor n=1 Tax=Agromyces TaxID=33877 RepID=UPI001E3AC842|nr:MULTISPECIES: RNA polymerase sigma factor [Agromyces]MCD5346189.1 RNA polymerase sigma factor [Agromyces sp. S2-1-8]MDF0512556.1 RNA polymerase sigma factor [Agromyces chromiiresistens]
MEQDRRSDSALWLEATSGTEAAFGVVYDRYRARIFRRAYAQVLNTADAEDIVAMVFLEAWRRRRSVRFVDGSLLPWLLIVTTNVSLNMRRSARRYDRLLAAVPRGPHAVDPSREVEERIDGERISGRLRSALERLTLPERRVVDLCLVEGYPLSDAAAALDVPIGSVKSRLSRARKKLKEALGESPWPESGVAGPPETPRSATASAGDMEVLG